MMTNQQELEQKISSSFSGLSKRLQEVARFVLDHPDQIALGTVAGIAESANVHPSTLVRFANAMDFKGFSEMQSLYKAQLVQSYSDYSPRIQSIKKETTLNNPGCATDWFAQLTEQNCIAMQKMVAKLDNQQVAAAVDLLCQADIIHIMAVRRAFPVATYFSYLLSNIGRRTHLLEGTGSLTRNQQSLISKNDIFVAISFSPYAPETLQMLEFASQQGCQVLTITDSPVSPLYLPANVSVLVEEAEIHAFRSLNNSMNLVKALSLAVIHQQNKE